MSPSTVLRRVRRLGARLARRPPWTAGIWIAGLLGVAVMDPRGQHLVSLCPLDALGATFCPGCGLGHAVAFLVRGELGASLQAHPLGLPALLLISIHVARLLDHTRQVDAHRHSPSSNRPSPSCRTSSSTSPNWKATSSSTSPIS